jgi:mRNA-degrading endonuclease RelE of RelBE toxin-antitoxin system
MEIGFHKQFKKKLRKLPKPVREQFYNRLDIFVKDMYSPVLHNHSVHPVYELCFSINISGDYRAIFKKEIDAVIFITIGTHSELY